MIRRINFDGSAKAGPARYEREKREEMAAWCECFRSGDGIPGKKVDDWLRKLFRGIEVRSPA